MTDDEPIYHDLGIGDIAPNIIVGRVESDAVLFHVEPSTRESVRVLLPVDVENRSVTVRVRDGWKVIVEDWVDE